MKRSPKLLAYLLSIFFLCCSQTPKKISYVILEKPNRPIETEISKSKQVQFGKYRIGVGGLFPIGLNSYLKEVETSNPILRNVEIEMKFPFCILPLIPFVCFARYEVIVEGEISKR
ncbi:hypothetical protein JWG44_12230 [Leptospira sp. 201903071]|uniref:LIC10260 family lipoprotein n=1 Tax=Leptospira ainazelensis TaxID=2810034 RepID=UPI00196244A7|nr:hypothetical protein [Leptospira ainazelensis]MBM9501019.1 hypothetical protein [Leptospira ainazelensis]